MKLEKLYEAFGELLYVVAMADGIIQEEEKEVLNDILTTHPWGNEIAESFNYEVEKGTSPELLYKKVLSFCHGQGPHPEYQKLLELMEFLAAANNGIDENEQAVINNFTKDLTQRFKDDLDRMDLLHKEERE